MASTHLVTFRPVDGAGCFSGDAQPAQMTDVETPSLNQESAAQKQAVSPSWSEAGLKPFCCPIVTLTFALRLLQCCENNLIKVFPLQL